MDPETVMLHVFTKLAGAWMAKQSLLEPGTLLTREIMSRKLPNRAHTDRDYDEEPWNYSGRGTARTEPLGERSNALAKGAAMLRKLSLLEPGQLVTRQDMARKMPPKRWQLKDWEEEPWVTGRTAVRTAPHAAFD